MTLELMPTWDHPEEDGFVILASTAMGPYRPRLRAVLSANRTTPLRAIFNGSYFYFRYYEQVLHTLWPRAGPALRGDEPCCTPSTPAVAAAAAAAAAAANAATEVRAVLGTASEAANTSVAVTGYGFDVFGTSTLATARCKFGTVITPVLSIELSGIALSRAPLAPPPPPEPPPTSADDGASSAGSSTAERTAATTGTSMHACTEKALSACLIPPPYPEP